MITIKRILLISLLSFIHFINAQPTGNEELTLDLYDVFNDDENKSEKSKIRDLKKISVGSFEIESSLFQNSIDKIEKYDLSDEQKMLKIHFTTLNFTITDTVSKKLQTKTELLV